VFTRLGPCFVLDQCTDLLPPPLAGARAGPVVLSYPVRVHIEYRYFLDRLRAAAVLGLPVVTTPPQRIDLVARCGQGDRDLQLHVTRSR
jgi:hypothetical protein